MKIYNNNELNNLLKENKSNWVNINHRYIKTSFTFKDFKTSIRFINEIADISEKMNHHPDIKISYNKVELQIYTHSKNAITELDIKFSLLVDDLHKKYID